MTEGDIRSIHTRLDALGGVPQRIDELHETIKETAAIARADREEIKANQRVTNGRLRESELTQARHEGVIQFLKWLIPIGIALPAVLQTAQELAK